MADSAHITAAMIARLQADSALRAAMPDGVFFGVAPGGLTRFVIVSLASALDTPQFQGRAFESLVYLVKAVHLHAQPATVNTAAARVEALLDHQALTATGYGHVSAMRTDRVQYVEVDQTDPDIRWQHAGGLYEVFASAN